MKISVDISTQKILHKYGLGSSFRFRKVLASNVARRCDKYVPMDTGILKNTVQVAGDGSNIVYNKPYARRQYTVPYKHKDPNRCSYWDKRMIANEGPQLEADMQSYIERNKEG